VEERLQKILSRAGIASRRAAERILGEGRITVNGTTVRELGSKADLAHDDVRVDGVRVRTPDRPIYLMLNKPKGVVTTRRDPQGRSTVMDLVPAVAGLFPVGRLDVTTEGLLLLTNDGAFAERVSHPRYEVPRVYQAKVHGVPDEGTLARLRRGLMVEGERLAVDTVRVLEAEKNAWLELTLHEGKHHEIKRLLEAVGHPVSKLKRVAIGALTTRGLAPGEFRALTPQEVSALLRGGTGGRAPAPLPHPPRGNRRRATRLTPAGATRRDAKPRVRPTSKRQRRGTAPHAGRKGTGR